MVLREVNGENERLNSNNVQATLAPQRLVEVKNAGAISQMSREEVDALKERNDIRIHDEGDKATVLNRLR